MLLILVAALALQPSPAMLRQLYEHEFERNPTAQAARDLGQFLVRQGDIPAARKALGEAVRLSGTLGDVAELAAISQPVVAEPLWKRAAESPDGEIATRSLAALGTFRER